MMGMESPVPIIKARRIFSGGLPSSPARRASMETTKTKPKIWDANHKNGLEKDSETGYEPMMMMSTCHDPICIYDLLSTLNSNATGSNEKVKKPMSAAITIMGAKLSLFTTFAFCQLPKINNSLTFYTYQP